MVKGRLKTERILIVWAVITAIWGHISYLTNIHNLTTYSYTALILFWVFSLKKEIPDTYVRRLMSLGGYLLTLLYILRFIKYNLVTKYTFPDYETLIDFKSSFFTLEQINIFCFSSF